MVNLLPDDRDIIEKYPLENTLDHLQDALRKAEQSYDEAVDSSDQRFQKAISRLLAALIGQAVALDLRSKVGNRDLASELATLLGRVRKGDFNYDHYRALLRLVIRKASDVDIWSAVFNLIIIISRLTPPSSIPPSFDDTPITHSSASQQGSEQTEKLLHAPIFHEIMKCTYRGVKGFFQKYFEGKKWTKRSKDIYNVMKSRHVDGRWTDFPDPPVQDDVCKWLFHFQAEFLSDARGVYCTSRKTSELTGAEARRQLDLFVKRKNETEGTTHDWKDVHVIGEHKQSKEDPKSLLLQLSRYMRDVFTAQPTRRFIHGFCLCGTLIELWVFDRSGPYSSGSFDIHEEPEQFIQAIAGYVMMNDEELGLDTFFERDGEDRFISIEDTTGKEKRLQLERDPIVIQRAIVCRGTSCYRSKDLNHAVKFSWTSDKRPPEADHLRLAREKGVKGVARLLGHRQITSIEEMRKGLIFPAPHHFRITSPNASSSQSQSHLELPRSFGSFRGLSIAESSLGKRKSNDNDTKEHKRSRSNSQKSKQSQEYEAKQASRNAQTTSLYVPSDGSFNNRLFCCLTISPAGRAISQFNSTEELLAALRDAIKAHKSLYIQGEILHRDISENNIIITNPEKTDGFTGMLIDLDLAKAVGSGRSGARHQTGTMEFMAIQVLQRVAHTYRHDLESFFYVLLWICARRAWEKEFQCKLRDRPTRNILSKWYMGSYDDIADAKRGYMHVDGFEAVLGEFPRAFDCVKPLCRRIRGILFPYENGLLVGTPSGPPNKLYDPIIEAFDNGIADMAAEKDLG